jgi:hypothetical protein
MKNYLSTNYLGIILYALFGFFLGAGGISVANKPFEFLVILVTVIAIDINSAYVMSKTKYE